MKLVAPALSTKCWIRDGLHLCVSEHSLQCNTAPAVKDYRDLPNQIALLGLDNWLSILLLE